MLLDRTALSDPLSDHHHLETAGAKIENLRQWAVADYLGQPTPFGEFFREDPEGRFGLAVLTRELDRWRPEHRTSEITVRGYALGVLAFVIEQWRGDRCGQGGTEPGLAQ